jgi:hypothetical protein
MSTETRTLGYRMPEEYCTSELRWRIPICGHDILQQKWMVPVAIPDNPPDFPCHWTSEWRDVPTEARP